MEKDIATFKDFLSFTNQNSSTEEECKVCACNPCNCQDYESEEENELYYNDPIKLSENKINLLKNEFDLSENELSKIEESVEISDYYSLYRDVNESFSCDIFIEGANPDRTLVRLVIESSDWNLVFNGKIENGKCIIPIKKLDILKENSVGNIKLEVIAENNVFVPWENKFLIKSSKKISTLNERLERKIGVKVDKIR